ncbi:MAG TPA: HAMP domain-containing sensor histidine kinase [Bacteroidales bacterium]|nr:HAMP domain-containing sensor histidine kinase [Bacteroidales bacterium]HOK73789.1 HAMP domain-containing sensor histidine kinase [Bacteroidales bacterium]HOM40045.1 HAMP domain-containing sensor histidine kinase [Bacteroidales bacterium]HOU29898.1 HAMP domain-containing sensor histidine kinase [Bacteroidales bacterium]HPP91770.1 HAMP domain-containing sensor histidine kinase [Bacteroidales bacterium]
MNIYSHKTLWKLILLFLAVGIGMFSFCYTYLLVRNLKSEERKKIEIWAEAIRQLNFAADTGQTLEFLSSIIEGNTTIPVILADGKDSIISARNYDPMKLTAPNFLQTRLKKIKEKSEPVIIYLPDGHINKVYYEDSIILRKLIYYPIVQLSIIILFILVSYLAFNSSRKAEQNQVWVGMSKETAHQLGTPVSSLTGWVEMLRSKYPEIPFTEEIATDIARLEKITERFSKIGSRPELISTNIIPVLRQTIDYLRSRASSRTVFINEYDPLAEIVVKFNPPLISWVIENVCKNAIDATNGEGTINISVTEMRNYVIIDIRDNGKGIPRSAHKKIFSPGYTTKQRGWGLGLSLSKRIIEEYHKGKIFVKYSEPGLGTCIRIMLRKN